VRKCHGGIALCPEESGHRAEMQKAYFYVLGRRAVKRKLHTGISLCLGEKDNKEETLYRHTFMSWK